VTEVRIVTVWQVWACNKHMTFRSSHDTEADAREHAEAWRHRGQRSEVRLVQTRRVVASEALVPTVAKQIREQHKDRMSDLRDALTYYKSGSNGTEVPQLTHLVGE